MNCVVSPSVTQYFVRFNTRVGGIYSCAEEKSKLVDVGISSTV